MIIMNSRKVTLIVTIVYMAVVLFPAGVLADSEGDDPSAELSVSPVDITGINAVNYPYIISYVSVNTTDGKEGGLKTEDFAVYEDGKPMEIASVQFSGPDTPTSLDLVIVFDDTGSLGDEIADLKEKVNQLTESISSATIDCRYSLITFKDTVTVQQEWTSDPAVIKKAVDGLEASGGDDEPEADLDAIETALAMGFRPDAQHMILDITDERTHYRGDGTPFSQYTIPETASHVMNAGVSYILVGPASVSGTFDDQNDKRELVKALGGSGLFFDIHRDEFSIILDKIQALITRTYTIGYYSKIRSADGSRHTIQVTVGTETDSGQFIASKSESLDELEGITPGGASQCTTVPVVISGTGFSPDVTIRLFQDSYTLNLTEIQITPTSITGMAQIPCDAPGGVYQVEVIVPGGKTWTGKNMFTISQAGPAGSEPSAESADEEVTGDDRTVSDDQKGGGIVNDECEGWEDNSGYYLKDRATGSSPAERIPNPWCRCSGHPYNRNYQVCIPVQS
jgi:hypothetical protein